jgi:putative ABC transport system permease protein
MRDLRFAFRSLRRAPAFALLIIATIALGIGPATAIFSVLDSLLLRELPYRNADSLAVLWRARESGDRAPVSGPDFADFQRLSTSFEDMAVASWTGSFNIGNIAEPVRVEGSRVSPNFFRLLDAPPRLGHTPTGAALNGEKLVILGEDLWRRAYGARTNVIGTETRLNGRPHRVVAVMPRAFAFPEKAEVWVPFELTPDTIGHRAVHQYRAIGRLKPDVPLARANDEIARIAKQLGEAYPDTTRGIDAWLMTICDSVAGNVRKPLLILFGAVVFLLLIACSNAANLMMTRAVARERELAMRAALGATNSRLARQLLAESLVLTTLGGLAGLAIAAFALRLLRTLGAAYFPRPDLISIDGRVLAFNFAIATITGVVFGLVPLLPRGDRFAELKSGTRAKSTHAFVRESIAVAVIALSCILLIGAGVLIRSFSRLRSVDVGIRADHLLTMRISLPDAKYPDLEGRTRIVQRVLDELRATRGVEGAATVSGLPTENTMSGDIAFPNEGNFTGSRRIASFTEISPGFFRTVGVPILEGRDFNNDDLRTLLQLDRAPVLINATMAERFWSGRSPLGEFVLVGGEAPSTIIGVVADVKQKNPSEPTPPHVYLALGTPMPPRPVTFIVRSSLPPRDVVAAMRRIMRSIDADVPPYKVRTMNEVIGDAFAGPRFQTVLLLVLASIALLLAIVGIYGVISYSVAQRTREIGIRMATGASYFAVLRLILGRVAKLALIGIALGGTCAIAFSRTLESLLFEVDAVDPRVFSSVAVLLVLTALFASAAPARRAASVDPSISLRYD